MKTTITLRKQRLPYENNGYRKEKTVTIGKERIPYRKNGYHKKTTAILTN